MHRVIGLVGLQTPVTATTADAVGIAAFFHDAGIWFDGTWDYLPPSAHRAVEEVGGAEAAHAGLVAAMITEHHRVPPPGTTTRWSRRSAGPASPTSAPG